MDNSVLIALIGASSSGLVAITALSLNYRGFAAIDSRFSSLENRFSSFESSVNNRFASLDRRLDMLQSDMKDLNRRKPEAAYRRVPDAADDCCSRFVQE